MYTDGSVNKDKPGLGFTVKQRTTTIHEENAANTVSTASLMIVETVTMSSNVLPPEMSVKPHMPSSSQIYWACHKKVKRGMGCVTGMCQMLEAHLLWMYCARHTVVTGNDPVDRLVGREGGGGAAVWRKPSQGACVSEDLKGRGALETTCGHEAKGTTPSIARRREAW